MAQREWREELCRGERQTLKLAAALTSAGQAEERERETDGREINPMLSRASNSGPSAL